MAIPTEHPAVVLRSHYRQLRAPAGRASIKKGATGIKRLAVVAASVVVLVGAGGSAAFAGEVKGPPNQPNNTNETGALDHANSACAASGLNDFDSQEGQNVSQVQTAADSWKYYGLPKGAPGTLGLCQGGTGQR
jgi:hypothetical protein